MVCTWTADCRSNVNKDAIMAMSDFDDTIEFIETIETETSDESKTKATTGQRNKQLKLSFEKLTPMQVHSRDPSHSGNVSTRDRAKQFKITTHTKMEENCFAQLVILDCSKYLTNILSKVNYYERKLIVMTYRNAKHCYSNSFCFFYLFFLFKQSSD